MKGDWVYIFNLIYNQYYKKTYVLMEEIVSVKKHFKSAV